MKHEVLDQEALLDFTHPGLRRVRPMMSRESRHHDESYRLQATSWNPCLLQSKVGTSKNENTAKDKPKTPTVNADIAAMSKSKPYIKQQQKCQLSEAAECSEIVHRGSQSVFDGRTTQRSSYTQSSDFTSGHQLYEQVYSGKRATLTKSAEPLLGLFSANRETRRRQLDMHNETRGLPSSPLHRGPQEENNKKTFSGSSSELFQQVGDSQNIKNLQKYRLPSKTQSQTAQMDGKSAVNRPDCVSKDYSCQSRDIDQKMDDSQCVHGLNRLKTCLLVSQTHEASNPVSAECTASHGGPSSKLDLRPHEYRINQEQSQGRHKSHKEMNASDTSLNQTDVSDPPDHHVVPKKLLEYPRPPSTAHSPFNTNSFGRCSKGVFQPPQHRIYQRAEETTSTASPQTHQLKCSVTDRAFITEDSEDPYYVTMYYPGSVYVGEYSND